MPISENELMWTRALPEEVEADFSEGGNDPLMAEPAKEAESPAEEDVASSETDGSAATDPVVRVEGASRLEATLARLEMNSLEIKLHLDALEQRIGRIEPAPQQAPRGPAEPAADLGFLRVASEELMADVGRQRAMEQGVSAAPAIPEARNDRWSHLMGPEVEARVPVFPPPLPVDPIPTPEVRPAPTLAREPDPRSAEPEGRFASTLAAEATPEVTPVLPVARHEPIRYATDAPAAPVPVAIPELRAEIDGTEAERVPSRRMFAVEKPQADPDVPVQGPGMWRGYRVRTLVLAALLLVLAAIPLAIWWQLSAEARDADAGDAAPTSRLDPAPPSAPTGKDQTATTGTRHTARARTSDGTLASLGNAGPAKRDADISDGRGAGAPVFRVQPAAVPARSSPPTRVPATAADNRPSGGTAAVVGTAVALGDRSAASEEVPGTSGLRVRVPAGVMAGHLLPTGDVGDLPRGSGEVVAAVFISNTGRVEQVQVISGTHGLRDSATRAIRNWRYEPYVKDGMRVPVVTTASIRFDGAGSEAQ